jgi:hypothetical protein
LVHYTENTEEERIYVEESTRDLSDLRPETCDPVVCVEPALADVSSYHPGRFAEPIGSPDGGWIAFTAWPFDEPEGLLLVSDDGV